MKFEIIIIAHSDSLSPANLHRLSGKEAATVTAHQSSPVAMETGKVKTLLMTATLSLIPPQMLGRSKL